MSAPTWIVTPPASVCGIYHLIRGDAVIYVGQTTNIVGRISAHLSRFQFDRVEFFACPVEELNKREEAELARLRPPLNREGVTRPYRVPPGQIGAQRQNAARIAERNAKAAS